MSTEIRIPWTKSLILKWSDFIGPQNLRTNQQAWTYTWIDYSHEINIIKKQYRTKFQFKKIEVTSYFRKSNSWVKPALLNRSDQATILKHEQGHLDLAEEYARKIQTQMESELMEKKFTCKGKTDAEQTEFAKNMAKKKLKMIWERLYPGWRKIEDLYDSETKYGMKPEIQQIYDDRFDRLRQ